MYGYSLVKFSSLPLSTSPKVALGQRTLAGETLIAVLVETDSVSAISQ